MTRESAIELIVSLIAAEIEIVKQNNFRSNGPTLTALRAERKAVSNLFEALTGQAPTSEELTEMT